MFSHWFHFELLDGRLIGSEHPENLVSDSAGKSEMMRNIATRLADERGVRTVLNLTANACPYGTELIEAHHIPMSDRHIGETPHATLEQAVGIIDERLRAESAVWVHCQGGIDRTGCIVACYLVSTGLGAEAAIAAVKDGWPERRKNNPVSHELWEPVAERVRDYASVKLAETGPGGPR